MKKYFLLLLYFVPVLVFSQTNLDSLWKLWNDPKQPDTIRYKAISNLAWDGYLYSNPDSAFILSQLGYDLALKKGSKEYQAEALSNQGVSLWMKGELGEAMPYHLRALKLREEVQEKAGIASSLNNIGLIYKDQGNYSKAIEYLTKSLKLQEERGNKKGVAAALGNIGIIYEDQADYEKALEYQTRALKIKEGIGDKRGMAITILNIGLIHSRKNDLETALKYYFSSLKIWETLGNKNGEATTLTNIGDVYQTQGKYEKALKCQTKSLALQREIGDRNGESHSLAAIGMLNQAMGNIDKAILYCKQSLEIAQETNNIVTKKNASYALFESYKKNGDYKSAVEMLQLYMSMKDSISSDEGKKAVMKQEMQYDYDKQKALDEKEHEKQIAVHTEQEQKQKIISYSIAGGLILLFLFSIFVVNRLRVTRNQKRIIEIQKTKIEAKQKEVIDSINYAKRIQNSLLSTEKYIDKTLKRLQKQ